MKRKILFQLFISLCLSSQAQVIFESGYLINQSNQKINCLIKNVDWKNNPTEFEYKINNSSPSQWANIETIKEFGIDSVSKYIRATVKIDQSSDIVEDLSFERNPDYKEEQVFLKVLIEGKASLYCYINGNLKRFFYKLGGSEIEQLVYKRYIKESKIIPNNYYKQQIINNLKCSAIKINLVEQINYSERDLKKIILKYNKCTNSGNSINFSKEKKDFFHLSLKTGLNYSTLQIHNNVSGYSDTNFGNIICFRFGAETEITLPYNKNKWNIIFEPSFQSSKKEVSEEWSYNPGTILVSTFNYKSIEFLIGIRHSFYLDNNSKIFLNVSYIPVFSINSSIELLRKYESSILNHEELEIKTRNNLSLGAGYKYNDKYSIELRYFTNLDIMSEYSQWNSDYRTISLIIGYTLF